MKDFGYTRTLRLNLSNTASLRQFLDKYPDSFDNVVFFSHHTHSVRNLDYHRQAADTAFTVIKELKKMGIGAGINILGTVGFFPENNDPALDSLPRYRALTGETNQGKLCPTNPSVLDYVKELYSIYASVEPDIIYIDDDVDELNCTCDQCLRLFNDRFKVLEKDNLTLEQLRGLLESNIRGVRDNTRKCWISHTASVRANLYELIERTVHAIDPRITLGLMTYTTCAGSFECELWANKLSANGRFEISWRPGGGVYTDESLFALCDKANRISSQIRYIPKYVTRIESEIENFPYQALNKSPDFTAFESFVYQAAGCTGTAYNIMSKEGIIDDEHEVFFKMAMESGDYGRLLSQCFGRSPARGVGFKWTGTTPTAPHKQSWSIFESVPLANDLHRIGLPFACEDGCISVYLLNRAVTEQLSDCELEECLRNGAYMDCEALEVCNRRGFGRLTGFTVKDRYDFDTMEIELDHPLNIPGRHRRNPRQAFNYAKQTFTIEASDIRAEYLAQQTDLEGNIRGMSAGIFENEAGGRIYVSGITPFEWCYSLPRSAHIKNLIRWISKNTVPAYISSFHRACIWVRGQAVFIANVSMSDIKDLEIMIRTEHKRLRAVTTKGSKINGDLILSSTEFGAYKKFVISELPVLGTALLIPQKS